MSTLLSSFFSARAAAPETDDVHAERDARKREIERILDGDDELRTEVEAAKAAREQQDLRVDRIESDPVELAEVGEGGYAAELQKRTAARMTLGKVLLRQREYRQQHDLPMLRMELNGILADEDAEARQKERQELIALLHEFQVEILDAGEALQTEIDRRFAAIEQRWPEMRVATDLPHMPPTVFTTHGSLRSIPSWHREVLALAAPQLFDVADPMRVKAEEQRAQGRAPVVWGPGMPPWG
jgi:hypothetical protein